MGGEGEESQGHWDRGGGGGGGEGGGGAEGEGRRGNHNPNLKGAEHKQVAGEQKLEHDSFQLIKHL